MSIPFPTPQWPSDLLEVGPTDDRAILLRGVAEIGDAMYEIIAIRINTIDMSADFRDNLPRQAYASCRVEDFFEDLAAHTEITDQSLVHLPTGGYVAMVIPAAEGHHE